MFDKILQPLKYYFKSSKYYRIKEHTKIKKILKKSSIFIKNSFFYSILKNITFLGVLSFYQNIIYILKNNEYFISTKKWVNG